MLVSFKTLGCKVNQYETEALKEQFGSRGYAVVGENDFADIYIINTCTVTGLADRKSRQYIRRMKKGNPNAVVAVTGCYAQISPEEVSKIDGVNLVVGTNEKGRLPEYIESYLKNQEECNNLGNSQETELHIKDYEALGDYEETGIITSMESRTRAYIKIQEGCNRFCSYCVIPYARGKVRSRKPQEILREAQTLIDNGFKELILTGINTALYGTEEGFGGFDEKKTAESEELQGVEIIIKALNDLPGKFRIRLSSLEPTVVNADYVKRLFKYEKLCPHLHLSIQSGSDAILKAMNRHYSREEYLAIVRELKAFDPGYGITTDIIAGFPGETQEDFEDSLKIIAEAGFCRVHPFKYSKRPGTKAATMENQISPSVNHDRVILLAKAGERASRAFFEANYGICRPVLFEDYDEDTGMASGYADNYIKVYLACESENQEQLQSDFVAVRLGKPYLDGVQGILSD